VLSFALAVADRVVVMARGRIVHESPRGDLDEESLGRYLVI
jgi:urea transport system ATP-binding protein